MYMHDAIHSKKTNYKTSIDRSSFICFNQIFLATLGKSLVMYIVVVEPPSQNDILYNIFSPHIVILFKSQTFQCPFLKAHTHTHTHSRTSLN